MQTETCNYKQYLNDHIKNVQECFSWLYSNLPELFEGFDAEYLGTIFSVHDFSKYSEEEFDAYNDYFYSERTKDVKEAFDFAWLHHQQNNPHHWQHWLLREDNGSLKALPMPYEYILEMICDWRSFSWKSNDLYEIFDWYDKNKSKMLLNEKTKQSVEDILELLEMKLNDVHKEYTDDE